MCCSFFSSCYRPARPRAIAPASPRTVINITINNGIINNGAPIERPHTAAPGARREIAFVQPQVAEVAAPAPLPIILGQVRFNSDIEMRFYDRDSSASDPNEEFVVPLPTARDHSIDAEFMAANSIGQIFTSSESSET